MSSFDDAIADNMGGRAESYRSASGIPIRNSYASGSLRSNPTYPSSFSGSPSKTYASERSQQHASASSKREASITAVSQRVQDDQEFWGMMSALGLRIQEITKNVATLNRLTDSLGTAKDTQDVRRALHVVMETTTELCKGAGLQFREISQHPRASEKAYRLKIDPIKREFQAALSEFDRHSQAAIVKQQQFVAKAKQTQPVKAAGKKKVIVGKYFEDEEAHQREDERQSLIEAERERQQQTEEEIRFNDVLIREREESILEIQRSIMDINQLFKDLANLVESQGVMIDNIETNINITLQDVEKAEEHIVVAKKSQSSFRCKLCVILLIIVLVAGGIATAVILTRK